MLIFGENKNGVKMVPESEIFKNCLYSTVWFFKLDFANFLRIPLSGTIFTPFLFL